MQGRTAIVSLGLCLVLAVGCSRQAEPSAAEENRATAAGDVSPAPDSSALNAALQANRQMANRQPGEDGSPSEVLATPRFGAHDPSAPPRVAPPVRVAMSDSAGGEKSTRPIAGDSAENGAAPSVSAPGLQLPPGNSPADLKSFLGIVDREIERLGSGRSEIQERDALVAEIGRVADLKQQAAERLLENSAEGTEDEAIGIRARMQALSHKAALGDLPAAQTLEKFAVELLNHPVDDIARDSRAVLIGFALERLQGGVTVEPNEVLGFVSQLASRPELLDASSLMAMQRAMMVLSQYGYDEAATTVHNQIANAFADLDDPQLVQLASEVLAAARFDELEMMRRNLSAANATTPESWRAKAAEVAAKEPDMMTLRYLASLALQMESMAMDESAAAIYAVIEEQLVGAADTEVATAAGEAVDAYKARREVIGQPLAIEATTNLAGEPISLEDYRGSVVLMPFWAVEDVGSIDALPGLEQFAAEFGQRVNLVGVNMDISPAGQERAAALSRGSMPWPSIAAVDSGGTAYASNLARQLGVVSLPTVVVLNESGEVAAVALSHAAVAATVEKLLQP